MPIIEYSEYGRTIKATASGGERLDVFLASACGETRSYVRRLIDEGEASVNGKDETKAGAKLKAGDAVELFIALPASTELAAEDIPLSIVYEDSDIAVIDKPKGMVVHPAPRRFIAYEAHRFYAAHWPPHQRHKHIEHRFCKAFHCLLGHCAFSFASISLIDIV